jgi:hypothetical protein
MSFDSGGFFNSTSNPETNTYNQNAGFSEINGSATSLNLVSGKKSRTNTTVNLLDGGAIGRAFDFGGAALKQVELAGAQTSATIEKAINAVAEAARSDGENVLVTGVKWIAIAAIAYFGFRALTKG